MKNYEKPKVYESGHYPEPVETGCCLLSCGGLTLGAATVLNKERFSNILKKLKDVLRKHN